VKYVLSKDFYVAWQSLSNILFFVLSRLVIGARCKKKTKTISSIDVVKRVKRVENRQTTQKKGWLASEKKHKKRITLQSRFL
jgi:hypothetical protein